MSFFSILHESRQRVRALEEKLSDELFSMAKFVGSVQHGSDQIPHRNPAELSVYKAWVISTEDPHLQGRVRFFSPYLHKPDMNTREYPFASPISSYSGFDDSGMVAVPPAGATIMIIFEAGFTNAPYYLGSIWTRNRGKGGAKIWDNIVNMKEYDDIHDTHRKGYFIGPGDNPNDESQVLPPWNTDNYQMLDPDSLSDIETDPDAWLRATIPHQSGIKSIQKHMIKMDDGDPKCNYRWKRMEIMSSTGNWMIFKDDHMHEGGQWAHPQCCDSSSGGSGGNADCLDEKGDPIEKLGSPGHCDPQPFVIQGECKNKYFKHKNECRPYTGPGTPQNNKCELPQSGVQILTYGGHSAIFDDSVAEPVGVPKWERSMQPFHWGCKNMCLGKMLFKSMTGHRLELNDEEYQLNEKWSTVHVKGMETGKPGLRGGKIKVEDGKYDPWDVISLPSQINEDLEMVPRPRPSRNGILLLTANGNRVELNDDTLPGDTGGPNRGITMQSTSNHTFEMIDFNNEQPSSKRKEGGVPAPKAKNAYVRIRSGYGLMLEMMDNFSQEEMQSQYVRLVTPQKGSCCGPHEIRLQENSDNECGQILVRAGGDYVRTVMGNDMVIVGDDEGCLEQADKLLFVVKGKYIIDVPKDLYYNHADQHIFFAEKHIILAAGRDCPPADNDNPTFDEMGPCLYPVLVGRCIKRCPIFPMMLHISEKSLSERVFASAKKPDECSDT